MPFVGAGISTGASIDLAHAPTADSPTMPRTWELTEKMLKRLEKSPIQDLLKDWHRAELHRLRSAAPSFADVAQLYTDVLSEDALFQDPDGPLAMGLFRAIEPTRAHHVLAWLAREGLFTEVITTNYDCALEKAYARTFSRPHAPAHGSFCPFVHHAVETLKCLRSIHDLEGYREHANQRQVNLPTHQPAYVLRIYKINGCAHAYKERTPAGSKPGFLIITDRHLQSFDARHWANDLFRDRFRCRQMVFTGFGAEEAQVRFTALRVIEEFARPNETASATSASPRDGASKPASPHCYIQACPPQLSSPQLQIAKSA